MKKFKKYIIIIILFVIVMIGILIFFIFRYDRIHLLNRTRDLLGYIYTIDEGKYNFKYGILDNGNITKTDYYIDGTGKVEKDKYGNVRFYIKSKEYCIYKTFLGNINIQKGECSEFKDLEASLNKNNTTISFEFKYPVSEYLISNRDDFKGEWKDISNNNLILNYYEEGIHYIWFKDTDGNISVPIKFTVECLNTTKSDFNKNIFYCNGSTVYIDKEEWIIIDNSFDKITMMKYLPISEKLAHCSGENSSFCNKNDKYKWSNSYINYYLNNVYIKNFSLKDDLLEYDICDDIDNKNCDGEYCGGYTKEEISSNNWSCNKYTKSKIRIINYYEYSLIVNKFKDISLFKGNYWMSDISNDNGYSLTSSGDVYIYENYNNKLDVRPIITIKK
ncbi:MAG: hypothetical protein MR938_05290 [Tenericutes bacterium]|nr:hypothetical protein [Mycoplasmatota bacterium]